MMGNAEIEKSVERLVNGNAGDEDIIRLLRWAKETPQNKRRLSSVLQLNDAVSTSFRPEDIDCRSAHASLKKKIRTSKRKRFVAISYRIAAFMILPLMLFSIFFHRKSVNDMLTARQTIVTPYGTKSFVVLPDGSDVWLNSGSSISFPVRFDKASREVDLRGEAYFEVQSDNGNPFVVRTGSMQVTATGTKFNISNYEGASCASVVLLSGRVSVKIDDYDDVLSPGQMIRHDENGIHSMSMTDAERWCCWKDGKTFFCDDSLHYVFERLGLLYNVNFEITDSELNDFLYRGSFDEESLDQILDVIAMSVPIAYNDCGYTTINGVRKRTIKVKKQ